MQNTLLLVDDERAVRKALCRSLRHDTYSILEASNGIEALDILSSEPVDAVLTDQRMPNMTGTELLCEIKNHHPGIPCIMVSGYSDFDDLVHAINDSNLYHFIAKPWGDDKLREITKLALIEKNLTLTRHAFHLKDEETGLLTLNSLFERIDQVIRLPCIMGICTPRLLLLELADHKSNSLDLSLKNRQKLLFSISKKLKRCLLSGDQLAYAGGYQFVIAIFDRQERNSLSQYISNIEMEFNQPVSIEKNGLIEVRDCSGTIVAPVFWYMGYSHSLKNEFEKAEDIYYRARQSLIENKIYENVESKHFLSKNRLSISDDFKRSIKYGEFDINYRNVLDLSTNQVIAVEGLVSWKHHFLDSVDHESVLVLADAIGQYKNFYLWYLCQSCLHSHQRMQDKNTLLLIRLSDRMVSDAEMPKLLGQTLSDFEISTDSVIVSVDQKSVSSSSASRKNIQKLINFNVGLCLENYSNRSFIPMFYGANPFGYLRVDAVMENENQLNFKSFNLSGFESGSVKIIGDCQRN